jgi:hypothetical protein
MKKWIDENEVVFKNRNDLDIKLRKFRVNCLNKIIKHLDQLDEYTNNFDLIEVLIDQLRKFENDVSS